MSDKCNWIGKHCGCPLQGPCEFYLGESIPPTPSNVEVERGKQPREWTAETIGGAPEGMYAVQTAFMSEWIGAIYTEYYNQGRPSEREVFNSIQLFTKDEAIHMFLRKDHLNVAWRAFGPLPTALPEKPEVGE